MDNFINSLKFDSSGLIPVVVQDFYNKDVLMVAYANKEAVAKTLETGYAHYYSRSRKQLWKKGETSGHIQKIKQIFYDCDSDTLLIKVEQKGAACHTNHRSCFYREYFRGKVRETEPVIDKNFNGIFYNMNSDEQDILKKIFRLLLQRKKELPDGSYTAKLFKKGENSILKKIGEEATEVVMAIKDKDESEVVYESADLIFHLLVSLAYVDISPDAIYKELEKRFGISGNFEKETR